jgi:hypothetical protein
MPITLSHTRSLPQQYADALVEHRRIIRAMRDKVTPELQEQLSDVLRQIAACETLMAARRKEAA